MDTTLPKIIAVTSSPDQQGFFIKYRQGKKEWVACEPYSYELYKQLVEKGFVP